MAYILCHCGFLSSVSQDKLFPLQLLLVMVFDHGNKKVTNTRGLRYTDMAENRGERGGEEEETNKDRKGNGGISPLDNMFANKYSNILERDHYKEKALKTNPF